MPLATGSSSSVRAAFSAAAGLFALSLVAGCAVVTPTASVEPVSAAVTITGNVHGGEQPVSGAVVQLWETGTTGYGSGAAQLVAQTTSAVNTGQFTFTTANVPGNCTSGPFAYITASGGDPSGLTTTDVNPAILLAAVVGSCSTTGASTQVVVNEVTTVAAAYALSNFATTSGAAGSLASLNVGAPATNAQGLADAIANALTLVSPSTGQPNSSTATLLLPSTAIYTLADTAASCVNSTTYQSSTCNTLFSLATPPNGTTPTNTFQALMNIAKYPGQNVGALVAAGQNHPPFAPTLVAGTGPTVLNDLTLGIAFPNSTLAGAKTGSAALTIDSTDDVWVLGAANSSYNYISELSNASGGYSITNSLGSTSPLASSNNIRNGLFDTLGNLWMSNGKTGGMIEIPSGTGAAGAVAYSFSTLNSALAANTYTVAVDGANNVWSTTYKAQAGCSSTSGSVCEYIELQKSGTTYTQTDAFNGNQVATPTVRGMAADANASLATYRGNIWATNYGTTTGVGNSVEILTPGTGVAATVTVGASGSAPVGVALDAASGGWIATTTIAGLYYVPANSTSASSIAAANVLNPPAAIPNATSAPASTATAPLPVGGLLTPVYDAVDGAGNVWVANSGNNSVVEYAPAYNCGTSCTGAFLSPYYGFSPSITTVASTANQSNFTCTGTTTVTCSIAGGAITSANTQIGIDRAGSVWTLAPTAGTLVEIIGTAAPTNPILASGQYGVKP